MNKFVMDLRYLFGCRMMALNVKKIVPKSAINRGFSPFISFRGHIKEPKCYMTYSWWRATVWKSFDNACENRRRSYPGRQSWWVEGSYLWWDGY